MLSGARSIYQAEPPRHRAKARPCFDLKLLLDRTPFRMQGLTEREIIHLLTARFERSVAVPLGFEDDVSAIPLSSKEWILTKTDMLVGDTDVPPGMSMRQAARKAVVATVSDFAAKGVKPIALMISLGLPAPARRQVVREIASGLIQASREYDCRIIGGDTNLA